jgi:hypothetical protein
MFNRKTSKLLIVAAAIATLAGCQTTTPVDYSAIRASSNATATGNRLGGGFVGGMTPEQACVYFIDNYKTKKNKLCKQVGKSDFSELTVVNKKITKSPDSKNQVTTIAFFSDKSGKLNMVQTVADDLADDGNNKNKTTREISDAYSGR